jgi:glutamate formiminotransferase
MHLRPFIECVPNFSEGRDAGKVQTILESILEGPEVLCLDQSIDPDHNRSVITFVGTETTVGEAALRAIGKAAQLINLNQHHGVHPRIGATDVVPFVPLQAAKLETCVQIARWVAEQAWVRYGIPTYLYGAAAGCSKRQNLEDIRRGGFESLREEVRTHPERRPDFGEAQLHPTAGATAVGARKFLIAYNINLNTSDVSVARAIARKIRTANGGLRCVKALGLPLASRNLAQVSMNLTDYEITPLRAVFEAVCREAKAQGIDILESEIVGLVPKAALQDASADELKIANFSPDKILENRLHRVLNDPPTGDFG